MRIEHMAMYVRDLERSRSFFQRYFGASSNSLYHNPKTGFSSYFLTFEGGARLEIMTKPGVADSTDVPRIGCAHVAFSLGSREKVDSLTALLLADGYEVVSGPRVTGDGYYESCVLDPDGIQVELTV
ncbi:MAG: VOC family protein [Ruminococcus sp.]|nr:VOC family protein [Ruminococcus sp.]MBQ3855132.1 VOC family protein [Ruminococcus sp.]HBB20735.1 glyoxalase [Ruminococcus sp.]HOO06683.1 VOC family protein [Ruminococcus sp.]HOR22608.1 VOC family protein [Ruminococcus sp.]